MRRPGPSAKSQKRQMGPASSIMRVFGPHGTAIDRTRTFLHEPELRSATTRTPRLPGSYGHRGPFSEVPDPLIFLTLEGLNQGVHASQELPSLWAANAQRRPWEKPSTPEPRYISMSVVGQIQAHGTLRCL